MSDPTTLDAIIKLLDRYVDRVNDAVALRNGPLVPVDTYQPQVPTVLAGLLARQATLTTRLAQSPPLWDGHVAPLVLRPMVECLITFRWILLNPVVRTGEYIAYGLGQAKLQLSKMQIEITNAENNYSKDRLIAAAKMQEAWILSQRLIQFVDVNLGSWAGASIRKMCEDTGDKELYDWWFVPHSACTHNMWQHVSIWNTRVCKNPMHQEHRLSHTAMPQLTLDYVHQSVKFFSEMVTDFDTYYGVELSTSSILEDFETELEQLE